MENKKQQQLSKGGKVPPQAIDIEETVLGALLLDFNEIGSGIMNLLQSNMFYKESHKFIFEAMEQLYSKSMNIDLLTVSNKLKENNKIEEIGGQYMLVTLTTSISSTVNVISYCHILIDKYLKRELIHDYSIGLEKCYDETVDSIQCIDIANKSIDKINDLINKKSKERHINEILKESLDNAEKRQLMSKNGEVIGIKTPLKELDYKTNGWQNGNLIIIAARPSMGKTSFALACLKEASFSGNSVAIFSLEMSDVSIADRLLCAESGVDLGSYKNGNISDIDWEKLNSARGRLIDLNITIDDNSSSSMEYIKNKARVLKKRGKCDMIIIDYLQLQEGNRSLPREQQISDISRKSKLLAKDLNIPVIQLSQLNRGCESRQDKKPMLSDIRESGAIEQDADVVMFLFRPSVYGLTGEDGRDLSGEGMIIIAKQREGSIGEVKYKHNESLTKYYNYYSEDNNEVGIYISNNQVF